MSKAMMTQLSLIADIASVIGLPITFWVLYQTFNLKKALARRVRLPELRKALSSIAKALPNQIKSGNLERNEMLSSLARAKGLLNNLSQKLDRGDRKAAINLISKLKGPRRYFFFRSGIAASDDDAFWSIHGDLQEIIAIVEQKEKDFKWE